VNLFETIFKTKNALAVLLISVIKKYFLNKQENKSIIYDRIKDSQSPEHFLAHANGSPNELKNLNTKKWRLLKTDEQYNIRQIETVGKPIGDLLDISVGIATLKDEVFFVDSRMTRDDNYLKITEKGTFEIEKEITRAVYKISDFKKQSDIEKNTRRIICPYRIKNGMAGVISESELKEKYPQCYAYFLSEKEILFARDKGKGVFEPFFAWGRTQGLTKKGIKILNPSFSQKPRFLLVNEEDAFFTNGYGIYFREQDRHSLFASETNLFSQVENRLELQKILNSVVMDYYVSKTSISIEGGYPCYQKNFIEKFTIPEFSKKDFETLKNLHDPLDIDAFLIEKYQLNLPVPNLVE
jgi:adenine-specific DNA-methyltransferase